MPTELVCSICGWRWNWHAEWCPSFKVSISPAPVGAEPLPSEMSADEQERAALIKRLTVKLDVARELLLDAYYQLDPIYLADGVTLHPGCVSTLHALYAFLWPNGKPANAALDMG